MHVYDVPPVGVGLLPLWEEIHASFMARHRNVDARAGDDEARFCTLAKQKGAENLQVFDAQSSTPEQQRRVLLNIDALTSAAPGEIHADFVLFDEFEHKLLDAGGEANSELAQEAGGQELRNALTRIGTYLNRHCGIHG